jgi:argininosuccinate lyase
MVNALDAVASRDYAFDITAALAITACDLSHLAEYLYLWNTYEFGFLEIGDDYAETSSIMHQKLNAGLIHRLRAGI